MALTVASASWAYSSEPQSDGRRYVTETFTLSDGSATSSSYLSDNSVNKDAHLADMVISVNDTLAVQAAQGA